MAKIAIGDTINVSSMPKREFTVLGVKLTCFDRSNDVRLEIHGHSSSDICRNAMKRASHAVYKGICDRYNPKYQTVEVKSKVSYPAWYMCCLLKIRHESRPLYRLKKWFLGLRWVNNWLWRRECETHKAYFADEWAETYYETHALHYKGVTLQLPDYPSIKELEQKTTINGDKI